MSAEPHPMDVQAASEVACRLYGWRVQGGYMSGDMLYIDACYAATWWPGRRLWSFDRVGAGRVQITPEQLRSGWEPGDPHQ